MKKLLLAILVTWFSFAANCSAIATKSGLVDVEIRAPSNFHCPPRRIKISFDSRFSWRERWLGLAALTNLRHLGVQVQMVESNPDVEIRNWRLHNCQDMLLGMHISFANFVLIDTSCMLSDRQYQAVVIHEVGHWLGMRHVCDTNGRTTDVCSPVGQGEAVLNPFLDWQHTTIPTRLDILEYNRACWAKSF